MKLAEIDISNITEGERARLDYGDIDSLTEDIKKNGLISPIALLELSDGKYRLLAGGRRIRALRKANITMIAAHIYDHKLTDAEMLAIELAENIQRKELEWDESVAIKKRLHDLLVSIHGEKVSRSPDAVGHSMADTAALLGESQANLSRDIQLAKMIERAPELATAKNKSTAAKMVDKVGKDIVREKQAAKVEKELADIGGDQIKQNIINNYFIADFFEGIRKVKDNTVDIIELDPPYAIDLHKQRKAEGTDTKVSMHGYNEIDVKDFPKFMEDTLFECYRILKPGGWIVTWFGPDPWFHLMNNWIKEAGFTGKAIPLIWAKPAGQTKRPDLYLANTYEMAFYARKGEAKLNVQGRGNIYSYKSVPDYDGKHPTERPIEMIQDILMTFGGPGNIVCVPFAGSGNTFLAAANLGMIAFGYDKTKDYKNTLTLKVKNGILGQFKSYNEE